MHADQGWRRGLGPVVLAWSALGLALMLGGADVRHYAVTACALGVFGGLAWIAQRLRRMRLAVGLLIAPPMIAAVGIFLVLIRLAVGFFL